MKSLELFVVVTFLAMLVAAVWGIPTSFKVMDRRRKKRDAAAAKLLGGGS